LWEPYDAEFAAELLAAARVAWAAALETPALFAPAADGNDGGGPYDDSNVGDEFYWAAAELFLTTGESAFENYVLDSEYHTADIWGPSGFDWKATAALGRLDLATVESDIPGREEIRDSVVEGAEKYLDWQDSQPFGTTYPGTAEGTYEWGSNSMLLNNQVVLATAFDLTGNDEYRDAVIEAMDYLLGRNALNHSYVTGYGDVYSENQHSRWFAKSINPELPSPPPGSVAGGPNSSIQDPVAQAVFGGSCVPQFCYLDDIQSWSTNEITVNWNSALSWVASFLADQGSGNVDEGLVVHIAESPEDVDVVDADTATFSASATGDPTPTVQWQVLDGDEWMDLAGETDTTLEFEADLADDGNQYRAVFTNEFGSAYTDPATLSVSERIVTVTLSANSVAPGKDVGVKATGLLSGESVELWLNSTPVLLETVTADSDGNVDAIVTIPSGASAGVHTVRVLGLESNAEGSASLRVAMLGQTGLSSNPTVWLGAALLLMTAGIVFVAVRRRPLRTE
jgi:endoglucanase